MKKISTFVGVGLLVLMMTACGSSNVVDYTGKKETTNQEEVSSDAFIGSYSAIAIEFQGEKRTMEEFGGTSTLELLENGTAKMTMDESTVSIPSWKYKDDKITMNINGDDAELFFEENLLVLHIEEQETINIYYEKTENDSSVLLETEQRGTDEEKTIQEDYAVNIAKFDISENAYEDGFRYEAIVEIENKSSSNIYLTGVAFDIEDANGKLIQNDSMISCCPDVIKPGEKGYLYNQFGSSLDGVTDIEGLQLIPQYVVKSTTKTPQEYEVTDVSLKEDNYGVTAVGRVTNDTQEDNPYLYVQILYYDHDGNIIGISGTSVTELLAGRTVSFEISGIDLPDDVTLDSIGDYRIIAQDTFFGW